MSDVFGCFMLGEELYVESEYSETVQNLLISTMNVHVRYDMDLMINSNAYEILLIWFVVIFLFIQYH
jgi:hypothetical protein